MRAALTEAAKVVGSGKLTLPITTTYKPPQVKEAIEHSQRGGKVLLDFNTQTRTCHKFLTGNGISHERRELR
jgi:hypothetical protein